MKGHLIRCHQDIVTEAEVSKECRFVEQWLLFSVCVVEDAKLVPEEQGEDGVRAKAEVGCSYTFVQAKNALFPSCLQQSVQQPPVHEALRAGWRGRERIG